MSDVRVRAAQREEERARMAMARELRVEIEEAERRRWDECLRWGSHHRDRELARAAFEVEIAGRMQEVVKRWVVAHEAYSRELERVGLTAVPPCRAPCSRGDCRPCSLPIQHPDESHYCEECRTGTKGRKGWEIR